MGLHLRHVGALVAVLGPAIVVVSSGLLLAGWLPDRNDLAARAGLDHI